MREILFKGKSLAGEWVEGFYYETPAAPVCIGEPKQPRGYIVRRNPLCGWDWGIPQPVEHIEVDPATVCQATGLLDKNGRMIFEGDVVHCVSRTDAGEMVVIFEEGEFRMVLCENYANYSTGMGFYAIRCFSKEILSNIHDKEVRDGKGV